jgi:dihydrolipoamide dehydrogenase
MPSKLLIAAADVAHEIRHAKEFGIEAGGAVRVDGPAVLERVRRHRDRFVGFVVSSVNDLPPEQRLRGRARFVTPTVLEVDDHTRVKAKAVVIAAGSTPFVPPSLAPFRDHVLTSDEVFELPDLPSSLAVVGTGAAGLEIGQAMHRLGVRTSLFSHGPRIGPISDPEVGKIVHEVLQRELEIHLDTLVAVSRTAAGKFVFRWSANGREEQREFDCVLAATGRQPNLEGLGLENTGLALDTRGIPVTDERTMQCGASPIFLAGDVDAERPVLHEAADEGSIAGSNAALFPDVRAHVRRTPLNIVFSDPQMAVVGRPYSLVDPEAIEIGTVSYADQGRAVVMAKNAGLVRIYAERETARLVGAEMFGPRVEHTAHLLAWAIARDLDVDTALHMPYYHPVVEEGIRTAIRDLCARLKFAAEPRPKDLECGPGV